MDSGVLRVGPRSAGSNPGPACFGRLSACGLSARSASRWRNATPARCCGARHGADRAGSEHGYRQRR
jgi:hypothetical protein